MPAVRRERLAPLPAALSLIQHARIAPLLGKSESGPLLHRATDLSQAVPVYALQVARDFTRLDEVVSSLMRLHDA